MSTLADSFLEDLDDLEDDDDEGDNEVEENVTGGANEEDDVDDGFEEVVAAIKEGGDLASVASLRSSASFVTQMAQIEASLAMPIQPITGNVEDNEE
jgi:hypothetical protein